MKKPIPQKNLLHQLREILQLQPTVPDEVVVEKAQAYANSLLSNQKNIEAQQRDKFLAGFLKLKQIIAKENTTDKAVDTARQQWQNKKIEQKDLLKKMTLAFVLAKRKAKQDEDRIFEPLPPKFEESYQPIPNPPIETYPAQFANDYSNVQDMLAELRLKGINIEAMVMIKDGVKSIVLLGVNALNFEQVRNTFKAYGFDFANLSVVANQNPDPNNDAIVFNPTPKAPNSL